MTESDQLYRNFKTFVSKNNSPALFSVSLCRFALPQVPLYCRFMTVVNCVAYNSVYYTRACGCLCMRAYVYELKIVSPDKSWRHTRIIVTTTTRVLARRIARTAPLAWGKRDGQIRAHLARETRSNVDSSVGRDQMWIAQLAERPMKKSQA